MTEIILVLNVGSSSIKFAAYPRDEITRAPLLRGKIAGIGNRPVFWACDESARALPQEDLMRFGPETQLDDLIPALLNWLKNHKRGLSIAAVGHRVVHGGRNHAGPALITQSRLTELDELVPLAPLHQPHNLAAIRCLAISAPGTPQVACFDTSFHKTQDRLAQLFALPRAMTDAGIIRYGFHGVSYEYIADRLPTYLGDKAEGRVLVAHLGNGASMCAMKSRKSVATSMGFTALDGLMMGRRCGAIDPGVILYLMNEKDMTAREVEHLLYKRSGLLGVSGISNNMAVLEANTTQDAREAIELFCYRAAGELAALATALGGLDAIVFTAGIGENSALVRHMITDRLSWLGVSLDPEANKHNTNRISSMTSDVAVYVIPTDEESIIAHATHALTDIGT